MDPGEMVQIVTVLLFALTMYALESTMAMPAGWFKFQTTLLGTVHGPIDPEETGHTVTVLLFAFTMYA